MLALSIPWLLLILIILTLVFLLRKKWWVAISLFIIAITVNWWFECVPLRLWHGQNTCNDICLRIVSWNIDGSTGEALEKARNVKAFLHEHPADIVFVAEFNEQYPRALDSLLSAEYAYKTYPDSLFFQYFYGNMPFVNSRRLKNSRDEWIGVYACSTILQGDTIDLYGCHLASNNYSLSNERTGPDDLNNKESVKTYIQNIQTASDRRKQEVDCIVRAIKESSHPAIVLGDMNDVSGSPALKILKHSGLKDSWWGAGFGYGATVSYPLPYRIDHIMHNEKLKTEYIELLDSHVCSDHHALYGVYSIIR